MILDFTNKNTSVEEVNNKMLSLDEIYDSYLLKIYNDYKRFIQVDLKNVISYYTDNYKEIREEPYISFVTKASLFENIRTELLLKFFRDNKIGQIKSFLAKPEEENNNIKNTFKTQFNISFNSSANVKSLIQICLKDIPSFEEVKTYIKGNPYVRIKLELEKQRHENALTTDMKKSLIAIFPNMQLDNPLIPYSMLKLVVNEFKRSNFLENVDDKLYQGIIILMGIGFEIGDISMLINMKEKDIMNITTENARKLIRD